MVILLHDEKIAEAVYFMFFYLVFPEYLLGFIQPNYHLSIWLVCEYVCKKDNFRNQILVNI